MSSDFFKNVVESFKGMVRQLVWHPSRLLVFEEGVLGGAIVAVGILTLYSCLPRPAPHVSVARSMQHVKNPFSSATKAEAPVKLLPASRSMIDAIKRAQSREDRGIFDEATRTAWKAATAEVIRLGLMPIATGPSSHVRLFMQEEEEERAKSLESLIEELVPGRFADLQRQRESAVEAAPELADAVPPVTWQMVAAAAPEGSQALARSLAGMHEEACANARTIARYRSLVSYDYWRAVCEAGASEPGFQARAAMWQAEYDAAQSQLELAKASFERGFEAWRAACDIVPALQTDSLVAEEMAVHQARYREVLAALGAVAAREPAADEPAVLDL